MLKGLIKLAIHSFQLPQILNLNPFFPASVVPELIAPSTNMPASNFLFSLTRMILKVTAAKIAISAIAQFTIIATVYFGEALARYM